MELFSFPDKLTSLNLSSDKYLLSEEHVSSLPTSFLCLVLPGTYLSPFPHPFNPDPTWKWGSTYTMAFCLHVGSVL